MKFLSTKIPGLIVIDPDIFEDKRGFFFECYHADKFKEGGINDLFVQDNHSKSAQGTLRGLHYQLDPNSQAKLVRVISGEIFDVAVDIRKNSPTFGKWEGIVLSAENKKQFFVPRGFAHGFYVLSESTEVLYKCSTLYHPQSDRSIHWNDPAVGIQWPIISGLAPILSQKDEKAPLLNQAEINF